jgi:prolyl oligopeptidase
MMSRLKHILGLFGLMAACVIPAYAANLGPVPETRREAVADQQFGINVPDPYRWLETDVRQSADVKDWVGAQNKLTNAYLAQLPGQAYFKAQLTNLINFERYGVPIQAGSKLFYSRNSGLQNQSVLLVRDVDGKAAPKVLIDPNGWAKDGATALGSYEPSHNGAKLAYQIQDGGTDWRIVKVMDVASAKDDADELRWVKFSGIDWAADNSGFFYGRFPKPEAGAEFQSTNLNNAIYFHKLGTPQSDDKLIFETPDQPKLSHSVQLSENGRWLLIFSRLGTDNRPEVRAIDLAQANAPVRILVAGHDNAYTYAGSDKDKIYLITDLDAPLGRIVSIDLASPGPVVLNPIVTQSRATLSGAALIGGRIIAEYLDDVKADVRVFDLGGLAKGRIALPGIGSVGGFGGRNDKPVTYFAFTSFNAPSTVYRLDVTNLKPTPFLVPKSSFDPKSIVVEQVFYPSKDGTKIPMFVVRRAKMDMTKPHPTLLYGYGGFDVSLTPAFSATRIAWIEAGGIYAVANLRGGGEYGKPWHDGGRLLQKQNVFDDFIAAGEYLIRQGMTTPQQLAIQGGSNGGLLVGAVVNQRPDLFAAALPAVGVMDMLRYTRFTAGRYWTDDYGDPAEEVHFKNLLSYSPYHNIKGGRDYPAILATTADTDDRVVPGHSFKYMAALQAASVGPKPHLIRIETRAGHGSGKPTDKIIAETADLWAFIAYHTGLQVSAKP